MKRILMAGVFAALGATPAMAVEFNTGDKGCLGYDAANHSCMSIQEVVSTKDGTLTVADRTMLRLGSGPLTILSRGSLVRDGERLCVKAGASEYKAEPTSHVYAKAMPSMLRRQMGALTKMGHCVEHEMCGDTLIVNSYLGGVEASSMRQVFRMFRKDDPQAATLTARVTTVAQMERLGGVMPAGCTAGAS